MQVKFVVVWLVPGMLLSLLQLIKADYKCYPEPIHSPIVFRQMIFKKPPLQTIFKIKFLTVSEILQCLQCDEILFFGFKHLTIYQIEVLN